MEKRMFAKFSKLPNVIGRVDYISNPKRQENLLAFYQTPADPQQFWKVLSEDSQELSSYNKAQMEEHNRIENGRFKAGEIKRRNLLKTVEAREMMLCLPNDILGRYDSQKIAEFIAADFKTRHGVECAVGIHLNKTKTNYHAHVIIPERVELEQTKESIATRNTYFNAEGKRSNKKDCVDENGVLLPGCRLVKKGELLHQRRFSEKNPLFANKGFAYGEKLHFAKIFNQMSRDHWVVYNHYINPHVRLYSIKQGEPEALSDWKKRENAKIRLYNAVIDELINKGELTTEQALAAKQGLYIRRAEEREQRARKREEWMRYRKSVSRERYERDWRNEKQKIAYTKSGHKRTTFELLVIFGLGLAGIDVLKKHDIDETLMLKPKVIKAGTDPNIQKMIDDVCIATGREPPSVTAAKNKIKRLAELSEKAENLDERIAINQEIQKLKENLNQNARSQTTGRVLADIVLSEKN